jgi:hypothetical protein
MIELLSERDDLKPIGVHLAEILQYIKNRKLAIFWPGKVR